MSFQMSKQQSKAYMRPSPRPADLCRGTDVLVSDEGGEWQGWRAKVEVPPNSEGNLTVTGGGYSASVKISEVAVVHKEQALVVQHSDKQELPEFRRDASIGSLHKHTHKALAQITQRKGTQRGAVVWRDPDGVLQSDNLLANCDKRKVAYQDTLFAAIKSGELCGAKVRTADGGESGIVATKWLKQHSVIAADCGALWSPKMWQRQKQPAALGVHCTDIPSELIQKVFGRWAGGDLVLESFTNGSNEMRCMRDPTWGLLQMEANVGGFLAVCPLLSPPVRIVYFTLRNIGKGEELVQSFPGDVWYSWHLDKWRKTLVARLKGALEPPIERGMAGRLFDRAGCSRHEFDTSMCRYISVLHGGSLVEHTKASESPTTLQHTPHVVCDDISSDVLGELITALKALGTKRPHQSELAALLRMQGPSTAVRVRFVKCRAHPVASVHAAAACEGSGLLEPVLVYTGRLSTEEGLNESNAYLWAIDPEGYNGQQLWVDASKVGNEARYVNDAWPLSSKALKLKRSANMYVDIVYDAERQAPAPVMFAKRPIGEQEELIVDYGVNYWSVYRRQMYRIRCREHLQFGASLQHQCMQLEDMQPSTARCNGGPCKGGQWLSTAPHAPIQLPVVPTAQGIEPMGFEQFNENPMFAITRSSPQARNRKRKKFDDFDYRRS